MMDRKIAEYLVMGKRHRWSKEQSGIGGGRLAKVQELAHTLVVATHRIHGRKVHFLASSIRSIRA
jgi:hypothetical protein